MNQPFVPYKASSSSRTDGLSWLLMGSALFILLTVVLVVLTESWIPDDRRYIVLGLYVGVNALCGTAAYQIFLLLWKNLWHWAQRIFLGLCVLLVLVFAVTSTFDLLSYPLQVLVAKGTLVDLNYLLDTPNEFSLFTWWLMLPLQVVIWLLLAIVIQFVRRYARLHGRVTFDVGRSIIAMYTFFILALMAVGLMFYTMLEVVDIRF